MAVSISAPVKKVVRGNERVAYVDITGPASYTSPGGEALSAADIVKLCGGKAGAVIGDIVQLDAEPSTAGHTLVLDRANSKIKYFNGTTEIANAVNLSAVVCRVSVAHSVANG